MWAFPARTHFMAWLGYSFPGMPSVTIRVFLPEMEGSRRWGSFGLLRPQTHISRFTFFFLEPRKNGRQQRDIVVS